MDKNTNKRLKKVNSMKQPTKKTANRYTNYSETTQDFMSAVEKFIKAKYGKIEKHWMGQLDLLAANYELFFLANEEIKKDGMMIQNRFGGFDKHPLLRQITDSNIQVIKLIHEFGLSPSAIGKIKTEDTDDKDYLDNLMND